MVSFGLVCSSFVAISRGSTHRHYFLPLGDEAAPSVKLGNVLAARTGQWGIPSRIVRKELCGWWPLVRL